MPLKRLGFFFLIVAVSAPLWSPLSAAPTELIANGGFEAGISGWQPFGGQLAHVSTPVYSGNLAATYTSADFKGKWFYQDVPVISGATYNFSGWALKNSQNIAEVKLRISWYSENTGFGYGQAAGSEISSITSGALTSDSPAYRFLSTGEVGAPDKAVVARLKVILVPASGNSATAYFDALSFIGPKPASPTLPASLLQGGGEGVAQESPTGGSEDIPAIIPTTTPSPIPLLKPTPTVIPTPTPIPTSTLRPTRTPTVRPTPTPRPTRTPTVRLTPTPRPTRTPAVRLTPISPPTRTPTVSRTQRSQATAISVVTPSSPHSVASPAPTLLSPFPASVSPKPVSKSLEIPSEPPATFLDKAKSHQSDTTPQAENIKSSPSSAPAQITSRPLNTTSQNNGSTPKPIPSSHQAVAQPTPIITEHFSSPKVALSSFSVQDELTARPPLKKSSPEPGPEPGSPVVNLAITLASLGAASAALSLWLKKWV